MTVADVIVVHFAFGSPFGVYQITRGVRSARSAVAVAAYFVLWPFFAAAFANCTYSRRYRSCGVLESLNSGGL